MIANGTELKVAVRNLRIMEEGLRSLRTRLEVENPWLLAVTAKAYTRRIAALQEEITGYLAQHPEQLSLILPPVEEVTGLLPPIPSPTA